jgi:endonuclease YncB( thermonuclease family)
MVGLPLAAFAAVLLWPTPHPTPREAPAATAPAAPPASQADLRARLWPTSADALDAAQPAIEPASQPAFAPDALATHFTLCGGGARIDCVVDGDTFWLHGQKIRLADINTPEVSAPQCAREAALGAQATGRLQALLNAGPFTLERVDRDRDRYGRLLRTVTRGGESLGLVLVREGLAEVWRGSRSSWC